MQLLANMVLVGPLLVSAATAQVQVNLNTKYQTIDGFGFSQAFGRASEFQNAASGLRTQALDLLFSTTKGAGFSIIRNRIGSGGSGDSIEPKAPSSPSASPAYTWDGNDKGQVWFTKQAVGYGVKTIYADAWSAPGFMKTSGNEATPGYLCGTPGHSCSSGDWRQAYANFLVKYVQYYAQEGITVTHLGFLNEPDYKVSYSQMQISPNAAEAIDFVDFLYKTVQAAGLKTKITCCDAVGWPMQNKYTTALANAGKFNTEIEVVTSHMYSGDATSPLTQTTRPKWNTEGAPSTPFVTTWYQSGADNEGFTWAKKLATAMVNAQLSAYLYWEGFENKQTQSSSHLVDTRDGTNATPSGIFWAFAMWSRYIRPGAVRVGTSGSIGNVVIGAFQNTDKSVVAVLTNSGSSSASASVSFNGFTPQTAAAWQTSQGNNFVTTAAKLTNGAAAVTVPAHGVVTVKLT